ncbi:MAG: hypothetical protein ACE5E9_06525 [Nitrospinaceae bacterium]
MGEENQSRDKQIDLKEIVVSNICAIDSLVELLEEKGILTRREFLDRVNRRKAQRQS